ncbi:MAG TPA: SLBB domain-containing protein [Candidatus Avidesulfovibrio excrementigallinarum]|nr:SLBB domain-containing protein [Candidatus Avidesulfovibrio excrementigallinarum]
MDKQAFLDAVRAAGIVGEGGAGFPAHVKYAATVDTVIANGCECEPLLHTDQHIILAHAAEIVRAFLALKEATGASRAVIALKRKYTQSIAVLRAAIGSAPVELALLDNFYPAGDEQTLVREVTGRSVPPLGLPLHVGCVVANVGTLYSVSKALGLAGQGPQPFFMKTVTVTGDVANPGVLEAPLGTPLMECLAAAGGPRVADPVFVIGGPMMGRMVESVDALSRETVTKTTGGLIVLPRGHYLHRNATQSVERMRRRAAASCIQCRSCSEQCPRHLLGHPFETHRVMRAFGAGQEMVVECAKQALLCCDCGVCEHFACPMGLSPRRINQAVKAAFRAQKIAYDGPRDINEAQTTWRPMRRVPVPRLASRLDIVRYMDLPTAELGVLQPSRVSISLRQHIGAPAVPVVKPGDHVQAGDLIGDIPVGQDGKPALCARIHASISGVVQSVDGAVVIGK